MQFLSEKKIEKSKLDLIFEASRWAASSYNEQPWYYIWADNSDKESYNRILDLLMEYNKGWASTAPLLMITVASERLARNGKKNHYALYDLGMSVANMITQAVSLGLQAHQMGGFDKERAKIDLDIPEGFSPVSAIAIGYPDSVENVADAYYERAKEPKERKAVSEFVFEGLFRKG